MQIALIGADTDGTPIHYEVLINPQRPIPFGASNVHGIYDSDVEANQISIICKEISDLMKGSVIVGHNARKFDMPLLENEFYRCRVSPPKPVVVLDTLETVRRLKIPRPHNLEHNVPDMESTYPTLTMQLQMQQRAFCCCGN